jgi:hypothetical protein
MGFKSWGLGYKQQFIIDANTIEHQEWNIGICNIIDICLIVNCDLTFSIADTEIQTWKSKLLIKGCKFNHQ